MEQTNLGYILVKILLFNYLRNFKTGVDNIWNDYIL